MTIPARLELLADLAQKTARLSGAVAGISSRARLLLDRTANKLPDLPGILGAARQRLDDRGERLTLSLPNYAVLQHRKLDGLANRLRHPRETIALHRNAMLRLAHRLDADLPTRLRGYEKRLEPAAYRLTHPGAAIAARRNIIGMLAQRLNAPMPGKLKESRLRLENASARLEAVSYASVLARGFALVTNMQDIPVTSVNQVNFNAALHIKFSDGDILVNPVTKQGVLPF